MQRGIVLLAAAAAFQPAPPRRRRPPPQAANLEEAVRRKLQEAQRLDARLDEAKAKQLERTEDAAAR